MSLGRNNFENNLATGKLGESKIAKWLIWQGWNVLPVYEKEIDDGKGPQLFTEDEDLIAPDLFAFKNKDTRAWWIEAKHKSVFSFHRKTQRWVTGIDIINYKDYLKVNDLSPWPIWLFFLHQKDSISKRNEPWPCSTGLFGQTLDILARCENHRHTNWGRGGMVYWAEKSLKKLAPLDEVNMVAANPNIERCKTPRIDLLSAEQLSLFE